MLPPLTQHNGADRALGDIVQLRNFLPLHSARGQFSDSYDLLFCQDGGMIFAANGRFSAKNSKSVKSVLVWRTILDVCYLIVGFIPVYVIYLMTWWGLTEKGNGNNAMHIKCFLLEVLIQRNLHISVRSYHKWDNAFSIARPSMIDYGKFLYSSLIGYLVESLASYNISPLFSKFTHITYNCNTG